MHEWEDHDFDQREAMVQNGTNQGFESDTSSDINAIPDLRHAGYPSTDTEDYNTMPANSQQKGTQGGRNHNIFQLKSHIFN